MVDLTALRNSVGTVESLVLAVLYIWLLSKVFSRETTLWLKILTFFMLAYNFLALTMNIILLHKDEEWNDWRIEPSSKYYFILLDIFYCSSQIMISFKYFDSVRQAENLRTLGSDEV
jgi:TRAP-type uncharacterized transport system fused permease subunit